MGAHETKREVAAEATVAVEPAACATPRRNVAVIAGVMCFAFTVAATLTVAAADDTAAPLTVAIAVSPKLPADINVPGGAPSATLTQAAAFAWQEFIALNWPAVPQTGLQGARETADTTKFFGDPIYTDAKHPLVWHTYRGKVEIFTGTVVPPGSQLAGVVAGSYALKNLSPAGQKPYYGYDALPVYNYDGAAPIQPASGTPSTTTPWINCDESSQIGLDLIYAGAASANVNPSGNQILFLAKANRAQFDYLAPLGWWAATGVPPNTVAVAPTTTTATYVQQNLASPPPGSTEFVSFPNGTVELKAAWRKLASTENAARFYTTKVRYYVQPPTPPGTSTTPPPQYVDDIFALVALHIIHKTRTAPYFVFATFEQADNITDPNGNPVETADGAIIGTPAATALTPDIVSQNATAQSYQTFQPTQSNVQNPLGQLYYQNVPGNGLTTGTVLVNRRKHAIPAEVIAVNHAAHQAIASYIQQNFPAGTATPWAYYKLVNVQSAPIGGKTPGVEYTGPNAASFYQANSVVETDYNLQVFSGRFYPGNGPYESTVTNTITDFNLNGTPFANVAHAGSGYNMGGCMGCHGNQQHGGSDFSFILGSATGAPDTVAAAIGLVGASAPVTQTVAATPSPVKSVGVKRALKYRTQP